MARNSRPCTPVRFFARNFLRLSAGKLAKAMGVPRTRVERIANEQIGISADTALRLAEVFWTSPELWLNLQTAHDVQTARQEIGKDLEKIEPVKNQAA